MQALTGLSGLSGLVQSDPYAGLRVSLTSLWHLEEASGSRADAVGSNTLTSNNAVGQAVGKIGNAGQFVRASTQFLSRADNASLSTGELSFTVAAWVYLDSLPAASQLAIMSKDGGGANREYLLQYNVVANRFSFQMFTGAGASLAIATANNFGAASTSTWYYVVGWQDVAGGVAGISVNAGTANTTARVGTAADSTAAFQIGAQQGVSPWDGRLDEAAFWKNRVLSAADITQLYNGGAGVSL